MLALPLAPLSRQSEDSLGTPSPVQAPSSNRITVRVKDNGYPILTDAKSFLVNVSKPVEIKITRIEMSANGNLLLKWGSEAGATYIIMSKTNLDDPHWTEESELTIASEEGVYINSLPTARQRFYRIQRVP